MKVIKNINNNVSLCRDSSDREVICFGKGIGFMKPPYELPLTSIERVYYDVSDTYINLLHVLPEPLIRIATKTIDFAKMNIEDIQDPNVVFTLADHLDFAIKRNEQKIQVKMPVIYDVQHLFEREMEAGEFALRLLKEDMDICLPHEEAAYIALHIINAEAMQRPHASFANEERVIEKIVHIVEQECKIQVDKEESNYSRFVTHMHYLLKRGKKDEQMKTENRKLYETLTITFPHAYACIINIKGYLKEQTALELNEEECLYLMLHINRLCSREGRIE